MKYSKAQHGCIKPVEQTRIGNMQMHTNLGVASKVMWNASVPRGLAGAAKINSLSLIVDTLASQQRQVDLLHCMQDGVAENSRALAA